MPAWAPSPIAFTATVAANLDYTGATNQTSALQAVLDAAKTVQSAIDHSMFGTVSLTNATVHLLPGKVKVSGLTIPDHVRLQGNGTVLVANGSGFMVSQTGVFSRLDDLGFSGVNVGTGASGISTTGDHLEIRRCRFQDFAGRAMLLGGEGHTVYETFAQACLLDTGSLAAKTGILEVTGNGVTVIGNNEYAGGLSALTSVNAYKCAVVATGVLNVFQGVYAETADVGFYVVGTNQKFIGCTSDLNRGHGWEFNGGGGMVVDCVARGNSQDATGTYDGFRITDGAFDFVNCIAYPSGTNHKYGFNDQKSGTIPSSHYIMCKSVSHTTAAFNAASVAGAFTFADHDRIAVTGATPSVDLLVNIKLSNGGATNLTNFTNGVGGQRLVVWGDANTTIKNGATIATTSGADIAPSTTGIWEFILNGTVWKQL